MFPRLFSPITIGGVTIRNRIMSSGHDTVMAEGGLVTDRLIAYQEARARGGVGLIVIQVAGVHPTARYTSSELTADTDEAIPGYTALAEAIHRHGATVFGQLFHGGREIMDTEDGTLAVAWAPSAVPTERFHVMPRAMPEALIREIIDGFGAAAARLEAAGLDGVEVVASHGYLPSQFLNPRTNLRTDAWGGDATGRLRFLREALAACRAATGSGFVVGLRISIGEVTPEGLTEEEALAALAALDADGAMDYVQRRRRDVRHAGWIGSHRAAQRPSRTGTPRRWPPASSVSSGVPVIVAGAHQPAAGGRGDPRCRPRRHVRHDQGPDLRSGAAGQDRGRAPRRHPGLHRLQPGVHRPLPRGPPDLVHPVPRERARARVPAVGTRRPGAPCTGGWSPADVLVIGGGPAGLKAAAVAAERGHRVTLVEAERWVGGQVRLAQRLPGREEMGGAIANLEGEARRAGVTIVTGTQGRPRVRAGVGRRRGRHRDRRRPLPASAGDHR